MSGRGKKSKTQIQASKPEPPPFLQRIREQIVASEDAERREKSDKRKIERYHRGGDNQGDEDDDPAVVRLNREDLDEAEYKRMRTALETNYRLDYSDNQRTEPKQHIDLDIDSLIQNRAALKDRDATSGGKSSSSKVTSDQDERNRNRGSSASYEAAPIKSTSASSKLTTTSSSSGKTTNKKLTYGSSSEDEDD